MLWPSFKNFDVVIFVYEFLNSAILYTKLQHSQSPVKVLSFFLFLKSCVQTGQISRWTLKEIASLDFKVSVQH